MKHFRDPRFMALCLMLGMATLAHAQISVGGGGDPVSTFLQRVGAWLIGAPGRWLVVIGAGILFIRMMFTHDYRNVGAVIIGAIGMISLQTMITYWIG